MVNPVRAAVVSVMPIATGLLMTAPVHAQPGEMDGYTSVDRSEYQIRESQFAGTVFFATPDGRHCAIFWNHGPAGCDAVPIDAPPGTNQLRTSSVEAAHFVTSDIPTFTHPEAKVLPEGHRITLENTTCGVGFQGTVSCEVGEHGFTLAATYSVLR